MIISDGPFEIEVTVLSGQARGRNFWHVKLSYYGIVAVKTMGRELQSTAKLAFVLFDRLYAPAVLRHVDFLRDELQRAIKTMKHRGYERKLAEVFRPTFGVVAPSHPDAVSEEES